MTWITRDASSYRSVLLLRPDNLGDVVLFTGALRHLRSRFPGALITMCVKAYVRELLALCPYIDRLITWEDLGRPYLDWLPGHFREGRFGLWLRSKAAARHSADLLLAPVRSPDKSLHAVARGVRANERFGITGDLSNQTLDDAKLAAEHYTDQLQVAPERRWVHELEITRDFLRALDIEVTLDDIWPEVWSNDADRAWAAESIDRQKDAYVVGIAPGAASLAGKAYPADKYADVFCALPDIPVRVVLFGTGAERALCEDVGRSLARCPNVSAVNSLAGRSTVRQLAEALRLCDVVLGADTAPLHIATALRKPTVGIMGGGHYGRFYPWGNNALNRVANLPMDCYGCNWQCRYSTIRCVQEITPATVAAELAIVMTHLSGSSIEIGH